MERSNDNTRRRKSDIPWQVRLCISAFIIRFLIYFAAVVYVLRDDICVIDKMSLPKHYQKGLEYYRGKQMNL